MEKISEPGLLTTVQIIMKEALENEVARKVNEFQEFITLQ